MVRVPPSDTEFLKVKFQIFKPRNYSLKALLFGERIPEVRYGKINCFCPNLERNINEYLCSEVGICHENAWHSVVLGTH